LISSQLPAIEDYEQFVGAGALAELKLLASRLQGRSIQIVNSTYKGGGVAEILSRMVPLLIKLGVNVRWQVIHGSPQFFSVTKKLHNALHGRPEELTEEDIAVFWENQRFNIEQLSFTGDIFFIHDPQPLGLVKKRQESGGKWVWRCHIDISSPHPVAWTFIEPLIREFDAAVYHSPAFARELPLRQFFIPPSIDPLSDKNRELSQSQVEEILLRLGIKSDKPTVTQISRFDLLKDPLGVITAFNMVRQHIDCQLILAGGAAADDPEGELVLRLVREKVGDDPDIHILLLPPDSHLEINALQRFSRVILQKSLREGFGLTVTEALWKGKPVIASAVGGIPLQIRHGVTGLLVHSIEGAAYALRQVLADSELASWLGRNGREHVRQNFLITRHIRDYLLLFLVLDRPQDIIYL